MNEIDPITREIIQNALSSAADEMSLALYRTAYSTIVRDCLDYSTSLCNAQGEMIAQGVTIPLHLGSVPHAMETLLEKYGGDMEPEDVFIMNDPFGGGMHIPDIYVVKPIFIADRLISFAVSTAHHLDLGGRLPGSSACDNTEIFQEGFRIPWLKLFHRGEPDVAIFELMRTNVRVPEQTIGDLRAQVARLQYRRSRGPGARGAARPPDLCRLRRRPHRIHGTPDAGRDRRLARRQQHLYRLHGQRRSRRAEGAHTSENHGRGRFPDGRLYRYRSASPRCAQQHALLHRRRRRRLCPLRHAGRSAQYRRHVQTPEHHHRTRHPWWTSSCPAPPPCAA